MAVLGMGRMGQALARRLVDAEHDVVIWNRSPGRARELVDRGATEADSIGDAVKDAETVITMLADDDAVRAVALGEDGVRSALPGRATYVDSSTVSPILTQELSNRFAKFVAMPVLGSPSQVASGEATFLIGAEGNDADALATLLPALSEKHMRFERPHLAAVAKLTVNLLLLDGVVALAEAFAEGRSGGLSDGELRQLLGNSPMVAPGLKYRFEGVLTGEQEPFWSTTLGLKDARLATEAASSNGVDLPLTRTARDLYQKAASRWEEADIASVAQLYREED